MKKILLATTGLAGLVLVMGAAGPVSAADIRPAYKAPYAPPPPPCGQFGGFYVGANLGWGYGEHKWRDLDGFGPFAGAFLPNEASASVSGTVAGIQGGYNWQFRCTVFGIEADYNWADLNRDFIFTGPFGGAATLAVSSSLESFGTLRARTGVVVDNLLLYVTTGFAFANTERSVALTVPGLGQLGPFSDEKSRVGWTVGFGTEWAFAPSWSFKSEVLYARFETEETTHTCTLLCNPNRPVRFEHESSAWVTRFGINYRFGGYGGGYGGGGGMY